MSEPRRAPRRPGHGGPGGPMGPGEKAKDFKGTMKKLFGQMSRYKFSLLIVLIFAILSTIFMIVSPKILGNATDEIADGILAQNIYNQVHENLPSGVELPAGTKGEVLMNQIPQDVKDKLNDRQIQMLKELDLTVKPSINFEEVGKILLFLVALYALSAGFSYIQGFIMTGVTQKLTYGLRKQISEKMDRLPLKYYDSQSHGDILSRVTNDVDTVNQTLGQSLTQIVTSGHHPGGNSNHDVLHQLDHDSGGPVCSADIRDSHQHHCQVFSKTLYPAAAISGGHQRPCGGDVRRAQHCKGIQRRGTLGGRV